ncbi:MAG: glutathione S-transferase family protein [Alphaproteobacteria bacterium]
MKLRHNTTSPFVRKVMVFAHEAGVVDRLELLNTNTWDLKDDIVLVNPLGKIPTLILDDGTVIPESLLICEYLDRLHDGRPLIPTEWSERLTMMRRHALGHGMLEATQARLLEMRRPAEIQSPEWLSRQTGKIPRVLAALESDTGWLDEPVTLAHTTVATALGYLDFRAEDMPWRPDHPRLAAWFAEFEKRPSMQKTRPVEWRTAPTVIA